MNSSIKCGGLATLASACQPVLTDGSFGGGGEGAGSAAPNTAASTGSSNSTGSNATTASSGTGTGACVLDQSALGNCLLQ